MSNEPTRRAILSAAVALPAVIAAPALAETQPEDGDRYQLGFDSGSEIATLHMARAWIDRWKAAGGSFGISWNADGSFRSILRGMAEPCIWTPTDEGNPQLEPHQWLTDSAHQRGAVKVLDSLLTLVPGLQDAVMEIVGYQLLATDAREA